MNVVFRYVPLEYLNVNSIAYAPDYLSNPLTYRASEDTLAILRNPNDVQMNSENGMRAFTVFCHEQDLLARYAKAST